MEIETEVSALLATNSDAYGVQARYLDESSTCMNQAVNVAIAALRAPEERAQRCFFICERIRRHKALAEIEEKLCRSDRLFDSVANERLVVSVRTPVDQLRKPLAQ